jgi:hypothetical protein
MIRAHETTVEPVWPDPAARVLRAILSHAQIGKLPAFAHNNLQDIHPNRSANGSLL